MTSNNRPSADPLMHPIALAMQGMAIWHLLLGLTAITFTLTLVVTGASLENDTHGMSAMTAAEVAGGALVAGLLLGGISWATLGVAFWRPHWPLVLVPGLVGTLTAGVGEYMDWPVSYLIGGAVAYWMVRRQLERTSSPDSATG